MAINDYLRTSSLDVEGNINFRRLEERGRYNRLLLGRATRAEVGQDSEVNNPTARPPSWTQHGAGLSHAFAWPALSSSRHETQVLNAYSSGTFALESSPVPASGTSFYRKQQRFVRALFALTASANLNSLFTFVPVSGNFIPMTGSFYFDASLNASLVTMSLDVTVHGKIRDIRVWVEFLHVSSSNSTASLGFGIRSPNVYGFHGLPTINDPKLLGWRNFKESEGLSKFANTFIIYDPPVVIPGTSSIAAAGAYWGRDRHLRCVFWDGARISDGNNPKHADPIFADGIQDQNRIGSNSPSTTLLGNDWPWISDARVQEGGSHGAAGSPPTGWLTGPGGAPAANEFNTTGSNYGPSFMRPVYPMLPNIIEVGDLGQSYDPGILEGEPLGGDPIHGVFGVTNGLRPGLYGSDCFGRWQLIIWGNANGGQSVYFRQWRLEFLLDKQEGLSGISSQRRTGNVFSKPGFTRRYAVITGSWNTEFFRKYSVYEEVPESYSRTIGITANTGSIGSSDFAVFTRITGALDLKLGTTSSQWFLKNEFGTPYVPISSGTGEAITSELLETVESNASAVTGILFPKPLLDVSQTLKSALSKVSPTKTTRDLALERTSGSA